jgi:hypothetical protein
MTLKITTASEPIKVETICLTIYSQPGLGKTSLAFTASRPLMLDFDKGSYRAVDRGDVVQVANWSDVAAIKGEDLEHYDTIIIDTVGKALDALGAEIIAKNPKLAYGGALNQQGWGQLGVRFGAFLKLLHGFGKDIVLIAHMTEKNDGEAVKERLTIQGGSQNLVLTDSDVIARISIIDKQRNLVFSPTETAYGKDPGEIGSVIIPDASKAEYRTYLADTITSIKEGLNSLSEAQLERKGEVDWFREQLPKMMTDEEINAVLGRAKKVGRDVAKMVVDRATELGLHYDADVQGYVYLEEAGEGEAA